MAHMIYLEHASDEAKARCVKEGRKPSADDPYAAVMKDAVERVEPKMMTVTAIMAGPLSIRWDTGNYGGRVDRCQSRHFDRPLCSLNDPSHVLNHCVESVRRSVLCGCSRRRTSGAG